MRTAGTRNDVLLDVLFKSTFQECMHDYARATSPKGSVESFEHLGGLRTEIASRSNSDCLGSLHAKNSQIQWLKLVR
jgi:hypothetical protein